MIPFMKGGMAQEQASWLATATVSANHIYLADLLESVNPQLREAATHIDLGRAPEPGSFRVYTENQLREAAKLDLALNFPAQITVRRRGWPILPEQINTALVDAKLPAGPVTLLGAPETRTTNAMLRVTRTLPGSGPNVTLVRFECRDRSECAPFWGEIEGSGKWQQVLSAHNLSYVVPHRPVLVSPSRPAMLICEEPGIEVRMHVRPLGRAGMGETVRVYDPDTRHIFWAQVKAEDMVTSDLRRAK
jgi:hypothetical protein